MKRGFLFWIFSHSPFFHTISIESTHSLSTNQPGVRVEWWLDYLSTLAVSACVSTTFKQDDFSTMAFHATFDLVLEDQGWEVVLN
jgi:hypothetical protein